MPEVSKVIVKDESEMYKFTIFCFNLLSNLSEQRECYKEAVILVFTIFKTLYKTDSEKVMYLFKYYLMEILIYEAKKANEAKKYFFFKLVRLLIDSDATKEKLLELFLEKNTDQELTYQFISVLTENDEPRTDKSKKYFRKIKRLLRQVRTNSQLSIKVNCMKILSNLIPVYFKFVRKMMSKLEFIYYNARWNQLLKIRIINFLSLYINKINFELSRNDRSNMSTKTRPGIQYTQGIDENIQGLKLEINNVLNKIDMLLPLKNEVVQTADKEVLQIFLRRFRHLFNLHPLILEYYVDRLLRTDEQDFDKLSIERQIEKDDSQLFIDHSKDQFFVQLEEKCDTIVNNNFWQFEECVDKSENSNELQKHSSAIIMYLLKNYEANDNRDQYLFWKVFHFSFINCKFEELNFEYFDAIINQTFERIAKVLIHDNSYYIMDILKRLVMFEVKKEVSIRNFNIEFTDLMNECLNDDDIKNVFTPVYWTMNGNDIYVRHLEEIFGDKVELIKNK